MLPQDTIVAIATPPGRGGIGVVRISGPDARAIADRLVDHNGALEPRRATYARVMNIDRAVVTFFEAPHSYTGEDVIEVSAHGSPVLLRAIVGAAMGHGARLADRGEFTLRAFLNGRIDLVQAEAIGDMVAAVTPLQARSAFDQLEGTLTGRIETLDAALLDLVTRLEASLDFPEEGYRFVEPSDAAAAIGGVIARLEALAAEGRRGRLIREGATVAIVGRPNVGKSSLFNALAGADRAIVAERPGTTRDVITERVDIEGLAVTLVDTAGLREAHDFVEVEGVRRAERSADRADLLLLVLDRATPLTADDGALVERTADRPRVIVCNKSDASPAWSPGDLDGRASGVEPPRLVSALTGEGLDEVRSAIAKALGLADTREAPAITNARQLALVDRATEALRRGHTAACEGAPEELVLAELHDARAALEEVTGRRCAEELLRHIFDTFCIGK
jgi:tRNA modification GTPase